MPLFEFRQLFYLAHGAFVGTCSADVGSPLGAGPPGCVAHGARVGAIVPGTLEVSAIIGVPLGFGDALGPLVLAHGALVPGPGGCGADEPVSSVLRGAAAAWAAAIGATVLGSRSQLNNDPNGKCWTTGNLESTSALYILIMP